MSFTTGLRTRRLDYAAILAAWNAGATSSQLAARFHCSDAAICTIRARARRDGQFVRGTRTYARGPRLTLGQQGVASCITCRRPVTAHDRARVNRLLADTECCAWCGRRWDGLLKAPARIWTWLKATLATVDAE